MVGFFTRIHSWGPARLVALFTSSSCCSRTYICLAFNVHKGPVAFLLRELRCYFKWRRSHYPGEVPLLSYLVDTANPSFFPFSSRAHDGGWLVGRGAGGRWWVKAQSCLEMPTWGV